MQSTILGIAAGKLYGDTGRTRFDPFTVAMSAPDGTIALMSGAGEVNSHFSVPPYQYQALKTPGVRALLTSTEVMGGPATITCVFGTVKFHAANPKIIASVNAAMAEAMDLIAKDRRTAADLYLKASRDKISVDDLAAMIAMPGYEFTRTPNGVSKYAEQMYKTGAIKTQLKDWKEAFFPEAHNLPGN